MTQYCKIMRIIARILDSMIIVMTLLALVALYGNVREWMNTGKTTRKETLIGEMLDTPESRENLANSLIGKTTVRKETIPCANK